MWLASHITGVVPTGCYLRGMGGEGDSGPYTQALRVSMPVCHTALNDSAVCPCDYSLLHVAYTTFRPLINTPKSNIRFLVWQPIIGYVPDHRTTDAHFTTLNKTTTNWNKFFRSSLECFMREVQFASSQLLHTYVTWPLERRGSESRGPATNWHRSPWNITWDIIIEFTWSMLKCVRAVRCLPLPWHLSTVPELPEQPIYATFDATSVWKFFLQLSRIISHQRQ